MLGKYLATSHQTCRYLVDDEKMRKTPNAESRKRLPETFRLSREFQCRVVGNTGDKRGNAAICCN